MTQRSRPHRPPAPTVVLPRLHSTHLRTQIYALVLLSPLHRHLLWKKAAKEGNEGEQDMPHTDEGFTDDCDVLPPSPEELLARMTSEKECEELAYKLLVSLPRSRLATIQRRLAPLLQFDVVGSLPAEVSLQIFSHLPAPSLLTCALVSRRWRALADDQALWKRLCATEGWAWKQPSRVHAFDTPRNNSNGWEDDEGMGDSDEESENEEEDPVETAKAEWTLMQTELDSGFASMAVSSSSSKSVLRQIPRPKSRTRHNSAPAALAESTVLRPDYKRLFQTHTRLTNRVRAGSYRLSAIQTRGGPSNAHTTTIYCLQLYTDPATGVQVLFTGSRDRTVREWNLTTGLVERVIEGVHASSVLSICVHDGYIASAGSDRRVAVWNLTTNSLVKVIADHEDSVLCVRMDGNRLVSCSKDRTVRTYSFPDLEPQHVLGAHRAAVNAVSLSDTLIVSGSGDRSVRLWDAATGKLLRTFENHHTRGIASIDFVAPFVVSGSSDKHLRLFDIMSFSGWSTSPEYEMNPHHHPSSLAATTTTNLCPTCGSSTVACDRPALQQRCVHADLVRSVALGKDFVVSGSYDLTIKVWDRQTGALVADLAGGHSGRIFCVGMDATKIVSCGEDQRICVWDFSHGVDTSFIQL
ncbi:F-box/WD repeat-containing protein 11 [Mycena indigotica]|uniref:F-box/WD repeat-containing protein 11 n=1 Tax=Mycena indigotica TaxID=2126181 RepID=A0A8H6S9W8_9AGAR|nr:F-box/WD repeat-containing protein 11 [Mycena indigotica]KAF7295670.1 F-box/WD repeat-containing protein 11 [Mycena indigotica]